MSSRNTDNSAGAQAKALGLKSLKQAGDLITVSNKTFNNWSREKPLLLKATLIGCAVLIQQDDTGIIMMPVDIEKLLKKEK